jgi:hypothetical protein
MKPQSAKQKGRLHQQWTRDLLLELNPELTKDDVRSTSMGAGGEDVQLSSAARGLIPYQIECKSKKEISVCNWYEQAKEHGPHEPIVVVKQNQGKPLVIVDAVVFFQLIRKINGSF